MIKLLLNNTEVFPANLKDGIKVTRENPTITSSGSYTLDVELPLSVPENKRFFGAMDRVETHKEYTIYDMELRVGNKIMLVGTAVLTKTTEEVVTVQLLAGNSNSKFLNSTDEIYIDEIDYNKDTDGSITGTVGADIVGTWLSDNGFYGIWRTDYGIYVKEYKQQPVRNTHSIVGRRGYFVCAPFYDEDRDGEDMEEAAKYGNVVKGEETVVSKTSSVYDSDYSTETKLQLQNAHPNLLYILKKVCEYRGYELDLSYLKDYQYAEALYIASAIPSMQLKDMLPHWTIKAFIDEFSNLFNLTVFYEDNTKKCYIVSNDELLEDVVDLQDAVDEQEVEISDQEEGNSLAYSIIEYAETNNDVANVGNELREKYGTVYVEDPTDANVGKAAGQQSVDKQFWRFYGHDGTIKVVDNDAQNHVHLVDIFRPADRDSDSTVSLKIVPAKTVINELCPIYNMTEYDVEATMIDQQHPDTSKWKRVVTRKYHRSYERMLSLENGYGGYNRVSGSLWKKINGEEVNEGNGEKEDYMPVFFLSTGDNESAWSVYYKEIVTTEAVNHSDDGWDTESREDVDNGDVEGWKQMSYTRAMYFTDTEYDGFQNPQTGEPSSVVQKCSLALADRGYPWYIGQYHEDKAKKYNSKVILQKKFLSTDIPNIRSTFLIHGKKFICEKIEYNIGEEGLDPLMTGYFIEILNS